VGNPEAPAGQAVSASVFLVCDVVGRDAHSGKWILTGLFDTVWVERFPAAHAAMDVFFRVWIRSQEGAPSRDRHPAVIAYRTPSGRRGELPPFVLAPSANGLAEGSFRVQQFPLPEVGAYEFELVVDGRSVSRTWLRAEALPDRSGSTVQ
jgi:hypothetical protein